MQDFLEVMQKYAVFEGRARRKEYWMFTLFSFIFSAVVAIVDVVIGTYPILSVIFYLVILLPSLGVYVRRLHDTGKSGWWILLSFIPFGGIALFVFTLLESGPDNKYGPNPTAQG